MDVYQLDNCSLVIGLLIVCRVENAGRPFTFGFLNTNLLCIIHLTVDDTILKPLFQKRQRFVALPGVNVLPEATEA